MKLFEENIMQPINTTPSETVAELEEIVRGWIIASRQQKAKANLYFGTAGDGYWSDRKTQVSIVGIDVPDSEDAETEFAELVVRFDIRDWDTQQHGLIYTDSKFLADLRQHFADNGFSQTAVNDIDYSEQGMQGDDYVSLDVGEPFLREWRLLHEIYSPCLGAV